MLRIHPIRYKKKQEGVPQSSLLSTTLFNIKINDIIKEIFPDMNGSLYVDDCTISYISKYIQTIERKLQPNIDKINKWATENGFKFSETKTKCIHFCNKGNLLKDPKLHNKGKNIPFVE